MKAKDLRNSILQMAVQGKLVPQDPADEPASVLVERIRKERAKLIRDKMIRAPRGGESIIYRASDGSHYEKRVDTRGREGEPVCIDDEIPFEIPEGWEWVRYATIANTLAGYAFRSSDFKPSGKYRLLRGINLGVDEVRWKETAYINNMPLNAAPYMLEQGDVLLGLDRPWISGGLRVAIIDDAVDTYLVQRVLRIRRTAAANERWLKLLLETPLLRSAIAQDMTGISVPHISERQVTSILVPLPSLSEQLRITNRIAQLMPLIDAYGALEDARERLDAELPSRLRKSVLQMAVQGRLVPQDPTDEPASVLLDRIRSERARLVREGELKAPRGGESVIFRDSDGGHYEKRVDARGHEGEPVRIDDEIPFEIPESWEWARVSSVFNLVRGTGIKRSEITEVGEPCIRYGELYTTYETTITVVASHTDQEVYTKARKLLDGEVIATLTGENDIDIGRAAVNDTGEALAFGGDLLALKGNYVDGRFAAYCMNSPYMGLQRTAAASGNIIVHLSADKIGRFLIAIPPLAEQRRIADACDQILALLR